MKKRFFALTIILMTVASISVIAQRGRCPQGFQGKGYGNGPGPNPEMKAYFEQNVLPVIISEREALDKQISQADKKRLEEITEEIKSMRESMWARSAEIRESDERPTVEQRKAMREHRNNMHTLMDEVTEISLKYDAEISVSLDAIREQAETWRNDRMDRRREKNAQMRNAPGNMKSHGQGGFPGHGKAMGPGMGFKKVLSPEGFLLFDPDEPLPFMDETAAATEDDQFNLFPNPASASVQVSLTLEEKTDITIELFDKSGEVLITKSEQNAGKGIYTGTLDLEGLKTGIYFVKVDAGGNQQTQRLVIR